MPRRCFTDSDLLLRPQAGHPLLLLFSGALSGILASLLYLAPTVVRRSLITAFSQCSHRRHAAGHAAAGHRPLGSAGQDQPVFVCAPTAWLSGAIGLFALVVALVYLWNPKATALKPSAKGCPPGSSAPETGLRPVAGVRPSDFAPNTGTVSQ